MSEIKRRSWRKTVLWVGLWALILTALDQGSKLLVKSFSTPGDDSYFNTTGFFHLHPVYNFRTAELIKNRAENSSFGAGFWWALEILEIALALTLALILLRALYQLLVLAGLKAHGKLFFVLFVLAGAMFLCGTADRLLWTGALDFFCITFQMKNAAGQMQTGHFAFDVKDVYVYLFGILTFYCVLRVCMDFLIFKIKDPEGFALFKARLKVRFSRKKEKK